MIITCVFTLFISVRDCKCNFIQNWRLLKENFCMSEGVEQGTRAFPAIHSTRSKASFDLFTLLSQF